MNTLVRAGLAHHGLQTLVRGALVRIPYVAIAVRQQHGQAMDVEPSHEREHFEKRIVPFTQQQLYDVVADVNQYATFVPWCTASRVTTKVDDKHVVADLSVGFQLLSETYSSVITLDKPNSVKVDVPESSLFDYLINDWHFEKGEQPSTSLLSFYLRFAFRNPLYQRATDVFFEQVAKQMVSAFEHRCHVLYSSTRPHPGVYHRW